MVTYFHINFESVPFMEIMLYFDYQFERINGCIT